MRTTNTAIKADILKTFIQEDRNEIRILRERIHNITSSIIVASFAITAFLYGKSDACLTTDTRYSVLVDILLMCLVIISFIVLKRALVHARKALKGRQELLNNLSDDNQSDLNPFPDVSLRKPDILDGDLYLFIILALSILIAKVIIVHGLFGF